MVAASRKSSIKGKVERYYPLYPDYPQSGFLVFLFLIKEERAQAVFRLSSIYPDLDYLKKALPPTVEFFNQRGEKEGISIAGVSLLVPLILEKTIPLKSEYWTTTPTLHCTKNQLRYRAFLLVAQDPSSYDLLVLPIDFSKEGWLYSAAMPFARGADTKVVEAFLRQSDYQVCPEADKAAIYRMEKAFTFDWQTRETQQPN